MSEIISPCNGLARCFRHPTGCARIVSTSREDYAGRQSYKARRRRLWHIVREHYRLGAKWGMGPIPPRYHLYAILLMEQALEVEGQLQEIERERQRSATAPSLTTETSNRR